MNETTLHHTFEDELFFSLRDQRNSWAKVAIGAVAACVLSLGCLIVILPLNETKPFVVMVDKTTGEAEKLVQVRPATLDQRDAVVQAELVSYVVDRETYDPADNQQRITDVLSRSTNNAADTLKQTWNSASGQYPPNVYGKDVRVRVVVKSISIAPARERFGPGSRARAPYQGSRRGRTPDSRAKLRGNSGLRIRAERQCPPAGHLEEPARLCGPLLSY
jgi:type IV secretion system protein VirB8